MRGAWYSRASSSPRWRWRADVTGLTSNRDAGGSSTVIDSAEHPLGTCS